MNKYSMMLINKQEAQYLREHYPEACIVRTMKGHSKRGRYYCEETRWTKQALNEYKKSIAEGKGD